MVVGLQRLVLRPPIVESVKRHDHTIDGGAANRGSCLDWAHPTHIVWTAKHMPTAVCPVLRARNVRGIDRLNQSCFLRSFVFIFIAINATPNDGCISCCWNRTDLALEDLQVACKISIMGSFVATPLHHNSRHRIQSGDIEKRVHI